MAYWILRSEPDAYSWDDLVRDKGTEWNGVRNYTARNFLKDMQPGDLALFYHSQSDKAAVGVMDCSRCPTQRRNIVAADGPRWGDFIVGWL